MQTPHQREWYLRNRDKIIAKDKQMREENPEKYSQRAHDCYLRHRKERILKVKEYRAKNPDLLKEHDRAKYQKFKEGIKARVMRRSWEVRWKALIHYGGDPPRCVCCGEDNYFFLGFDHVNNDGAAFRRSSGSGATHLVYWLMKNNYPDGFQVLCHNCNFAKGHYGGFCPHMIEIEEEVE